MRCATTCLAALAAVGLSATTATADLSTAAWWNSVLYDGVSPSLPVHDDYAAAGSYGGNTLTGWAGNVPRGIYLFNSPAIIRNDNPGMMVDSATLTVSLDFFDTGAGHLDFLVPPGAPGAHAYHVEIADHTLAGNIAAGDYFAPQLQDLGLIVPATPGVPASIDYSIDITSALQTAVDNPAWGEMFAVRLHFGDETDGLVIDENLYFSYFFVQDSVLPPPKTRNPRIDYTLVPIPEPGSLVLGGLGLIALLAARRRR